MGSFLRASITDDNFIRGAARLLVADAGNPFPTQLSDLIQLTGTTTNEIQSIIATGGTAGTFRLGFKGAVTAAIPWNSNAAAVKAALEALPTVGSGNTTVGGGPLPATAVTVTFVNALAGGNQPTIVSLDDQVTAGDAIVTTTTPGAGQYDPAGAWVDLGATKTGVQIVRNNAEETFDVDQIMGDIESQPTSWEMNIGTQLAEVTLDTIDLAWQGGDATHAFPATGTEKHLPLGLPTTYDRKLLAVLHQRTNGKIRAHVFRKVQRLPQESTFTFAKTGEQISVPVRFRAIADSSVSDINARFGEIIDQV